MGSIAVGFGTMFAAPPKALFTMGKKKCQNGTESETSSSRSSIMSTESVQKSLPSADTISTLRKSPTENSWLSGVSHIHREDSVEYKKMKKELGQQGVGRALKGIAQGISHCKKIKSDVAPLDFSMAVAQGFHNLPMLYGQQVRHVDPVVDFSSGVKTAGKVYPRVLSDCSNSDLDFTMELLVSLWIQSKVPKRVEGKGFSRALVLGRSISLLNLALV